MAPRTTSQRVRAFLSVIAVGAALAVIAGCGASGGDSASDDETASSTTAAADTSSGADADSPDFGSIKSPCHDGEYSVADGEQQGAAGTIQIGVPNDRGSTIRPGLQKPIWDASVAFAEWCNAQGGIGGLKIEIIDMDGRRVDKVLAKRRWMHEQQRLQERAPSPRSSSAVAAGSAQ